MITSVPLVLRFAAILSLLILTAPNAWALVEPEVLPDGNLRDPMPTAEELKFHLTKTEKNMVPLKGGTFDMGDWGPEVHPEGLPFDHSFDSKPLHKVTLSDFYISKYPVTYAEFDIFTAALRLPRINQSEHAATYRKPDNPAGVTWQGASDYCNWLAQLTGKPFALPTEAQWEYTARSGGKRYIYPTDNGESEPGRNLPSFEQSEAAGGLLPVNRTVPNQAGIFYMGARISEFTRDWYDEDFYSKSPRLDPTGPIEGTVRVVRGFKGSYMSATTFKRWTTRLKELGGSWTFYGAGGATRSIPHTKYSNYATSAFRCVR